MELGACSIHTIVRKRPKVRQPRSTRSSTIARGVAKSELKLSPFVVSNRDESAMSKSRGRDENVLLWLVLYPTNHAHFRNEIRRPGRGGNADSLGLAPPPLF